MKRRLGGLLLLALMALHSATPAMSLREWRTLENQESLGAQQAQYYLSGVVEGALEANALTLRRGGGGLFCLEGRKLEPDMVRPLLQAELQRNADLYEADMPVSLVLLNALTTAYTC
jgi:hypothetical protein